MKKQPKLKRYLLLLSILSCVLLYSFNTPEVKVDWVKDFEKAKEIANKENKIILMSFSGSDWCVNCMKLEKILFESSDFSDFAEDKLVLLQLDFPSKKKNKLSENQQKHNNDLAEKYNKNGQFPTVIFLDNQANVLGSLKHPLNSANEYLGQIKKIIGD